MKPRRPDDDTLHSALCHGTPKSAVEELVGMLEAMARRIGVTGLARRLGRLREQFDYREALQEVRAAALLRLKKAVCGQGAVVRSFRALAATHVRFAVVDLARGAQRKERPVEPGSSMWSSSRPAPERGPLLEALRMLAVRSNNHGYYARAFIKAHEKDLVLDKLTRSELKGVLRTLSPDLATKSDGAFDTGLSRFRHALLQRVRGMETA